MLIKAKNSRKKVAVFDFNINLNSFGRSQNYSSQLIKWFIISEKLVKNMKTDVLS